MSLFTPEVNVDNTVLVDGSAVIQPISATSLPLPSGAATEASVSALTKPSDVQLVDGSATTQPVSGPLTDTQLRATPIPISGTVSVGASSAIATVTSVTVSPTVATLSTSNSNKTKVIVHNETGTLYVKLGSGASSSSYSYRLTANTVLEVSGYTGIITGTKVSGTTAALVTEVGI